MARRGIERRENAEEMRAAHEQHVERTSLQASHEHSAGMNHANFASENHGRPANAAYGRVNERQGNQQARIGQGVRSGQLTPRETGHLEGKEAAIHQEVHNVPRRQRWTSDRPGTRSGESSAESSEPRHRSR